MGVAPPELSSPGRPKGWSRIEPGAGNVAALCRSLRPQGRFPKTWEGFYATG